MTSWWREDAAPPGARATSAPAALPGPRRRAATVAVGAFVLLAFAALVGLGTWQVQRLGWKRALIAQVDQRVHGPPLPPPAWSSVTAAADAYRRVEVGGTFRNDRETLVQASTEFGPGYWVVTPLRTAAGATYLVNRGFVPPDRVAPSTRTAGTPSGPVEVTGLLRFSEPKGGFLRSNDPAGDRWFSRDVAAIAAARGLRDVAPYFIDADASPNPGGYPIGGLTVVAFPNNHLVYAFTWYTLAAMLGGAVAWNLRERLRQRAAGGIPARTRSPAS